MGIANAQFDPVWIASRFQIKRTNLASPMSGFTLIAKANANRVGLIFPSVPGNYNVCPGIPLTGDTGITVFSSSSPLIIKFSDVGGVVGMEWYVLSGGAGPISFTLTEIIFMPE